MRSKSDVVMADRLSFQDHAIGHRVAAERKWTRTCAGRAVVDSRLTAWRSVVRAVGTRCKSILAVKMPSTWWSGAGQWQRWVHPQRWLSVWLKDVLQAFLHGSVVGYRTVLVDYGPLGDIIDRICPPCSIYGVRLDPIWK